MFGRTCHFCLVLLTFFAGISQQAAYSQTIRAELNRGFARSSSIVVNVQEMLGTQLNRTANDAILGPGFPALWIAEVQYKPVRLLRLPVTDPQTQQTKRELVWYMVYRVIPRDYTELAGSEESRSNLLNRLRNEAVDPQNKPDEFRTDSLVMPRFVLQTTDEGAENTYVDEVNHGIQQAVLRREFRDNAKDRQLLNSIEAISAVGTQVSVDDPDALDHALYGVAIWRNVNPDTDFFRVIMSGFSNAYRLTSHDDGKIMVEDKCIVQEFGRPGDRFEQSDREFRVVGEPKWIYVPREATLDFPGVLSVLGNRTKDATVR
ncbi:MAG: hypothetical protein MK110_11400 [Fuerstiella sp.]|nr:hypothetical protein [Fuerstiella sp.]